MDKGTSFTSMYVRTCKRLGAIKIKDETDIGFNSGGIRLGRLGIAEAHALPILPLVFAKVQNLEGFAVGDVKESLTGGMNGETPKIAADPTTARLFSNNYCCASPIKKIGNQ